MFQHFSKTLMVLLICLTFFGQAMASTVMSYHMMSMENMSSMHQEQSSDQSTSMSMMDHSQNTMGNDLNNESEPSDDDCCDSFCNCFTSGCSPLFSIHRNISNDVVVDIAAKIYALPVQIQSQIPTSLYRPPILS
ncbi:CopL family metal-binding regulatory protein [Pseudocolwellia sp. HL-MZ19]|uniref:CopL family metal-binding regulatory protein n=1 Tax=unclassified Pseudocolwellia TaxID=2848178 RepID=UPI003CEE3BD9